MKIKFQAFLSVFFDQWPLISTLMPSHRTLVMTLPFASHLLKCMCHCWIVGKLNSAAKSAYLSCFSPRCFQSLSPRFVWHAVNIATNAICYPAPNHTLIVERRVYLLIGFTCLLGHALRFKFSNCSSFYGLSIIPSSLPPVLSLLHPTTRFL